MDKLQYFDQGYEMLIDEETQTHFHLDLVEA